MIFDPFGAMETLVMGIGIILLIEGAFNLGGAIYTALAIRRFNKLHPRYPVHPRAGHRPGPGRGRDDRRQPCPRGRRGHRPRAGYGG